MANPALGTRSPSYSSGTFTRSFDARPYMSCLIMLVVDAAGAGMTLDVDIQTSPGPDFSTWTTATKVGGGDASFTQVTPSNDNTVYYCSVDISKAQNAIGIEATVGGGLNRVRYGVYALLVPYDTSNSTDPQFRV